MKKATSRIVIGVLGATTLWLGVSMFGGALPKADAMRPPNFVERLGCFYDGKYYKHGETRDYGLIYYKCQDGVWVKYLRV